MKNVIVMICAVSVVLVAVPVFASVSTEGKNDCLLYGKNCPNAVDSLQERIFKLKTEIDKGEEIYTPTELNLLERRLNEDNNTLRMLNKPGR